MTGRKNTPRLLFVFGTRPEAIKLAPVILEAQRSSARMTARICLTGQHREMLEQVIDLFRLRVHHDLKIMKRGQSLEEITSGVLRRVESVILREHPDMIIVQGDTTTTFAAALAGFYRNIPVAHVEAGLRTWDRRRPFPEEMNRVLTTRLSNLHFAPTDQAAENLIGEGVPRKRIVVTGNTVIDALHLVRRRLARHGDRHLALFRGINFRKKIVLVTGHRRESFGGDFLDICAALRNIALKERDVQIVYPVHLNPNVQQPVRTMLSGMPNVFLLDPLDYEPFVWLMDRCTLILTDSGGVQEEAPSLGKPVLVMRDVTERPEGVEAGTVRLVGTDRRAIERETLRLLRDRRVYRRMSTAVNPYGDGRAGRRIVQAIRRFLREG